MPPSAIASREELALLRTRTPSGFRGVYYAASDQYRVPRYVAKVRCGGVLRCLPGSRSIDARVTATVLLAYYEKTFGPSWREALLARKRKAWRVWQSRARGGWCGRLYHRGRPVELIDPNDPDEVAVFPTKDAARAALDEFSRRLTGRPLMRNPDLWRLGGAVHTEHLFTYDDWVPPPPAPPAPPPEPRRPHPSSYKIASYVSAAEADRIRRTCAVWIRGERVRVPGVHFSLEAALAAVRAFAEQVTAEPWPCRRSLWRYPPAAREQVPGSPAMMSACSTSPQH